MSQDIESVLEKARKIVTPTEKEAKKLEDIATKVREKLDKAFQAAMIVPEIKLGGSYAKGTWLRGSADIDFFLLYPVDYSRENLEGESIKTSQDALKGYDIMLRFAEHPYVEAIVEGARVNVVPCYKVEKGAWQSAADRSPFHTQYIQTFFDDKLRTETRLFKRFVRNVGVYGAEIKTQGLSGYVCEILTLTFGSFEAVLNRLSILHRGEIFSIESYDKDVASTFTSAIVILDPVDTMRNLGTAISTKNLAKLILASRAFLAEPELRYFEEAAKKKKKKGKKTPNKELLERTVVVQFKTGPRSVDILWGQLQRSVESLANKIEMWGFQVLRKKAASNERDNSAFIFLLSETEISKFHLRTGPDVFRRDDFQKYMEKNQDRAVISWLDYEGRVLSLFEKERESRDIFKELEKVLKERDQVPSIGLSRSIQDEIQRFKVLSGSNVVKNSRSNNAWLRNDVLSIVTEDEEEQGEVGLFLASSS